MAPGALVRNQPDPSSKPSAGSLSLRTLRRIAAPCRVGVIARAAGRGRKGDGTRTPLGLVPGRREPRGCFPPALGRSEVGQDGAAWSLGV